MTTKEDLLSQIDAFGKAVRQRELSSAEIEKLAGTVSGLKEEVEELTPRKRSIRDLKGLGKDYWRSINIEEYLRKERESWD